VLRPPFAFDAQARAEWLGASWAANRFYHARISQILKDGADELGCPAVVRRWAEGRPLDHVVRSGAMDLALALRLAEQLLDALEMAHTHGIIHGALAPSNVIVTVRGSVRLVDFATAPGLIPQPASALMRARVSSFTAPEQVASSASIMQPTQQSDVWAVGACLHFALCGTPPTSEHPSWRRAGPEIGGDVTAVLERALAVDPLERYESAYAMLGDIRCLRAGRPPKLQSALVPLPSQSPTDIQPRPGSSSGVHGLQVVDRLTDVEFAKAMQGKADEVASGRPSEWRGNLLLIIAIALLVALATYVLVRERLADRQRPEVAASVSCFLGGSV
jgi:serine/threonine protein kinase